MTPFGIPYASEPYQVLFPVDIDDVRPGDIVVFRSQYHANRCEVGLYMGQDRLIIVGQRGKGLGPRVIDLVGLFDDQRVIAAYSHE